MHIVHLVPAAGGGTLLHARLTLTTEPVRYFLYYLLYYLLYHLLCSLC